MPKQAKTSRTCASVTLRVRWPTWTLATASFFGGGEAERERDEEALLEREELELPPELVRLREVDRLREDDVLLLLLWELFEIKIGCYAPARRSAASTVRKVTMQSGARCPHLDATTHRLPLDRGELLRLGEGMPAPHRRVLSQSTANAPSVDLNTDPDRHKVSQTTLDDKVMASINGLLCRTIEQCDPLGDQCAKVMSSTSTRTAVRMRAI